MSEGAALANFQFIAICVDFESGHKIERVMCTSWVRRTQDKNVSSINCTLVRFKTYSNRGFRNRKAFTQTKFFSWMLVCVQKVFLQTFLLIVRCFRKIRHDKCYEICQFLWYSMIILLGLSLLDVLCFGIASDEWNCGGNYLHRTLADYNGNVCR